jgi:hypothetical protein
MSVTGQICNCLSHWQSSKSKFHLFIGIEKIQLASKAAKAKLERKLKFYFSHKNLAKLCLDFADTFRLEID